MVGLWVIRLTDQLFGLLLVEEETVQLQVEGAIVAQPRS
jgi:hypothetical protein